MLDVLEMLINVVLALAVVGFVGYPLVRGAVAADEGPAMSEELEELLRRKESTYSALKELEFDFKTGKLSEDDFTELDARYREDALDILAAIEAAEKGVPAPSSRRRDTAKRARPRPVEPEPEEEFEAELEPGECPECGRVNSEDARFCASCGTVLVGGETEAEEADDEDVEDDEDDDVCGECGRELHPDHRFCAGCGAEVAS